MAAFTEWFNKITVARMQSFFRTLSEKDQRRYAVLEAQRLEHGGIAYIAKILGCSTRTIRRGINELDKLDTERRFFPHVSRACTGMLFDTLERAVELMRKASTSTGLRTTVNVIKKIYETGRNASDTIWIY